MAMAGVVGQGGLLRRPDGYTISHLRFAGPVGAATTRDQTGLQTWAAVNQGTLAAASRFFGQCYVGDGTTDSFIANSKTAWNKLHQVATYPKWSISFWYRLAVSPPSANCTIVDTMNVADNRSGMCIYFGTARGIRAKIGAGTALVCSSYDTLSIPNDTAWHYMVITYEHVRDPDTENMKIYCDGALLGTATKAATTPSAVGSYSYPQVGAAGAANAYSLNGNIDDLIVRSGIVIDGTVVPRRRF